MTQNVGTAGWYSDPAKQYEFRYWDGRSWTDAVAQNGQTFSHPLPTAAPQQPVATASDHPTLWNANVLLMSQKGKVVDLSNEHTIYSDSGAVLGYLKEPEVSGAKKVGRALVTTRGVYNLTDPGGGHLMQARRSNRFLIIDSPTGQVGRIKMANLVTLQRTKFEFQMGDQTLGTMAAKTWSDDWNMNIFDADGELVADVAKTAEGLGAALFTSSDHYRLTVHRPIEPMLRTLVTFSALMLDLVRFN